VAFMLGIRIAFFFWYLCIGTRAEKEYSSTNQEGKEDYTKYGHHNILQLICACGFFKIRLYYLCILNIGGGFLWFQLFLPLSLVN